MIKIHFLFSGNDTLLSLLSSKIYVSLSRPTVVYGGIFLGQVKFPCCRQVTSKSPYVPSDGAVTELVGMGGWGRQSYLTKINLIEKLFRLSYILL